LISVKNIALRDAVAVVKKLATASLQKQSMYQLILVSDARKLCQNVRRSTVLANDSKVVRVAVSPQVQPQKRLKRLVAEHRWYGIMAELSPKGEMNFDVSCCFCRSMVLFVMLGQIVRYSGLMPNPKDWYS